MGKPKGQKVGFEQVSGECRWKVSKNLQKRVSYKGSDKLSVIANPASIQQMNDGHLKKVYIRWTFNM